MHLRSSATSAAAAVLFVQVLACGSPPSTTVTADAAAVIDAATGSDAQVPCADPGPALTVVPWARGPVLTDAEIIMDLPFSGTASYNPQRVFVRGGRTYIWTVSHLLVIPPGAAATGLTPVKGGAIYAVSFTDTTIGILAAPGLATDGDYMFCVYDAETLALKRCASVLEDRNQIPAVISSPSHHRLFASIDGHLGLIDVDDEGNVAAPILGSDWPSSNFAFLPPSPGLTATHSDNRGCDAHALKWLAANPSVHTLGTTTHLGYASSTSQFWFGEKPTVVSGSYCTIETDRGCRETGPGPTFLNFVDDGILRRYALLARAGDGTPVTFRGDRYFIAGAESGREGTLWAVDPVAGTASSRVFDLQLPSPRSSPTGILGAADLGDSIGYFYLLSGEPRRQVIMLRLHVPPEPE